MSVLELAIASVTMAVGATVQGSIGFGLNVIAAPILTLVDTKLVPGPALAAAFTLTVLLSIRERSGIDRRGFGWVFVGRVPATIVAALLLASLPERGVAFTISAVVLLAVGLSLVGWRLRRTPGVFAAVGAASGVMGTLSSVGGPPLALLYQDARGSELRGTLSAIFVFGTIVSIGALVAVGRFGTEELLASVAMVPGVLLGYGLSRWTAPVVDRSALRPLVLAASALAAIAAIIRYAV
jgi:uncharacterized membrane protein YfcA